MPGLFRKPSKPSQSFLGCAVALAVGFTIEFLRRMSLDFNDVNIAILAPLLAALESAPLDIVRNR